MSYYRYFNADDDVWSNFTSSYSNQEDFTSYYEAVGKYCFHTAV